MKTRANGIPLMRCEAMGQMPCVKCKELFWPTAPLLCIEPPASFYFCEKCLAIIQPERSKRKDLLNNETDSKSENGRRVTSFAGPEGHNDSNKQ